MDKENNLIAYVTDDKEDIIKSQKLRYQVFGIEEGRNVHAIDGVESDEFDEYCKHLIVKDTLTDEVVGYYRLNIPETVKHTGKWYSESEFDLSNIKPILDSTIECGRACIKKEYRTGGAMLLLWAKLYEFMRDNNFKYFMGCASSSMDDGGYEASNLYHYLSEKYTTPKEFMVKTLSPINLELRNDAKVIVPPLVKGYLQLGGYICSEPSWDKDWNTSDLFILVAFDNLNSRYLKHFAKLNNNSAE
ncbi:MAG: GNAT family N-acyltransferase [Psittacicella sp.]